MAHETDYLAYELVDIGIRYMRDFDGCLGAKPRYNRAVACKNIGHCVEQRGRAAQKYRDVALIGIHESSEACDERRDRVRAHCLHTLHFVQTQYDRLTVNPFHHASDQDEHLRQSGWLRSGQVLRLAKIAKFAAVHCDSAQPCPQSKALKVRIHQLGNRLGEWFIAEELAQAPQILVASRHRHFLDGTLKETNDSVFAKNRHDAVSIQIIKHRAFCQVRAFDPNRVDLGQLSKLI